MAQAAMALLPAAGSIGASLFGRSQAKGATRLSPGEQAAQGGQTQAAEGMAKTGSQLTGMGMPQMQQAGRYFSSLAGGNQASMAQTLAPEVENIKGVYGGTARTLSRFLRGPERDVQMAEMGRERAGQISGLFRNARPQANAALAQFGGAAVDAGTAAQGGAASVFGNQAERGMRNRYAGADLEKQTGEDFGGLIFNMLRMYGKRPGGGAGGPSGFSPANAASLVGR